MTNRLVASSMKRRKSQVSPAPPIERVPQKRGVDAGMDEERRYRAKAALDTITQAERHKMDKKLMKDVTMVAKEHMAAMDAALGGGLKRGGKDKK